MDSSLIARLQAGQSAAAHAVGTSLASKNGAHTNTNTLSGTAAKAASSAVAAAATGSATGSTTGSSSASGAADITSSDFLTLLVSELKNQDPTQPTDPTAYISQLVQVNSLEQLIQINSGITSLEPATTTKSSTGA